MATTAVAKKPFLTHHLSPNSLVTPPLTVLFSAMHPAPARCLIVRPPQLTSSLIAPVSRTSPIPLSEPHSSPVASRSCRGEKRWASVLFSGADGTHATYITCHYKYSTCMCQQFLWGLYLLLLCINYHMYVHVFVHTYV